MFNFENNFFDDKLIIVECILKLDNEYIIKVIINNNCIDYLFIDIDIAYQVCEVLKISFLKLNKSREVKKYDEKKVKTLFISFIYLWSFKIILKTSFLW